jgi:membrane associated rhomboid family serine protease
VTPLLVGVNVALFVYALTAASKGQGGEPSVILQAALHPRAPEWWQFITYAFFHAGWLHLLGNMLVLYVFGGNLEDRLGRLGFTAFYLGGAVVAGLAHVLASQAPVIGASGAVAAVTGGYLVLFPRTHVRVLLFFIIIGLYMVPAWWFVMFAVGKDVLLTLTGQAGNVATMAHLGGYALGIAVACVLLATGLLRHEDYDLVAALRQARRRAALRRAVGGLVDRRLERVTVPASDRADRTGPDATADPRAMQRAAIVAALTAGRVDEAVERYEALTSGFSADCDAAPGQEGTVLPRRHQLDLANLMFAQRHYELAARAYAGFAEAYPADAETPRVRVMLALIWARYLGRPEAARTALARLGGALSDPEHRGLAEDLARELGVRLPTPG